MRQLPLPLHDITPAATVVSRRAFNSWTGVILPCGGAMITFWPRTSFTRRVTLALSLPFCGAICPVVALPSSRSLGGSTRCHSLPSCASTVLHARRRPGLWSGRGATTLLCIPFATRYALPPSVLRPPLSLKGYYGRPRGSHAAPARAA